MAELAARDMVKAAMEAGHTDNDSGLAFIKKRFNTDMRSQVFGRCRTQINSEGGLGSAVAAAGNATGGALTTVPTPAPATETAPTAVNPAIALALTLRDLIRSHGSQKVRDALDMVEAITGS